MITQATIARIALLSVAASHNARGLVPGALLLSALDYHHLKTHGADTSLEALTAAREAEKASRWVEAGEGVSVSFQAGALRRVCFPAGLGAELIDSVLGAGWVRGARVTWEAGEEGQEVAILSY